MQGICILTSSPVILGHIKFQNHCSTLFRAYIVLIGGAQTKKAHMANNKPGGQSKLAFVLFIESQNVRDK